MGVVLGKLPLLRAARRFEANSLERSLFVPQERDNTFGRRTWARKARGQLSRPWRMKKDDNARRDGENN